MFHGEGKDTTPSGRPTTGTLTNEGEGTTRAIVADLNVSGIDYKEHGAECGSEEQATGNGTYTGQITVKGEKAAEEHAGIWVK